jgi:hypothetical protein
MLSGTGHARPASLNRLIVSLTVVGPTPVRSPTTLVESPASRLKCNISRTWRIETLLVGIHSSGRYATAEMTQRSASPHLKLRAITSECCAHNSRNTARH